MDLASLIISIVGAVLSLVGIGVTLMLARRTASLEKSIKEKYSTSLAAMHFNETKQDHIQELKTIKSVIIANLSSELELKYWDDLVITIKRIERDLSLIGDDQTKTAENTIKEIMSLLSKTDYGTDYKNRMMVELFNDLIIFLETYKHLGG